jgi:Asp-tRNA(Asn)/Glu-tRNA(Gln) amidotransferase A subunit family amidase
MCILLLTLTLGCPIANVPLGRYNLKEKLSRPYGLAVLAKLGGEGNIFRFMAAYEANFPARVIPERLLSLSTLA